MVGNRLVHPKGALKGAVTGTVLIEHNRLEMINDHPEETAGYGVLADWTSGAEMTIRNNEIYRTPRATASKPWTTNWTPRAKDSSAWRSNRIATDDAGIAYPNKFGPNGIVIGWYFDTKGGADFSKE